MPQSSTHDQVDLQFFVVRGQDIGLLPVSRTCAVRTRAFNVVGSGTQQDGNAVIWKTQ